MKKVLFVLTSILLFTACKPVARVKLTLNGNTVVASGIPETDLHGLQQAMPNMHAWQSLLPVCLLPGDAETKDDAPPLPGSYQIINNQIIFTPATPFKAGSTYFARYYTLNEEISALDIALKRRQLGKPQYIELVFKP